jgi:TetR/AcrR family transcriptional regulator, regulator of cefoperazone and chloramphenicol sensitivity
MSPRKVSAEPSTDARQRLLERACRLFSERGFEAVSTREICAAAEVNPGAIHYHFGDKDGLYREVLRQPIEHMSAQFVGFDDPSLTLAQALHRFLTPFLHMGNGGDMSVMRLHLRELLDPSPAFAQTLAEHVGPHHRRLAELLARHAGAATADTAIHQLAYGLVAMAHDYCLSRAFMDAITPGLLADDPHLTQLHHRLVNWGCALVAFERERRRS